MDTWDLIVERASSPAPGWLVGIILLVALGFEAWRERAKDEIKRLEQHVGRLQKQLNSLTETVSFNSESAGWAISDFRALRDAVCEDPKINSALHRHLNERAAEKFEPEDRTSDDQAPNSRKP